MGLREALLVVAQQGFSPHCILLFCGSELLSGLSILNDRALGRRRWARLHFYHQNSKDQIQRRNLMDHHTEDAIWSQRLRLA